ncbi:putative kinase-like protein TMKL1 [Impatiens glandulifera]|uniref:putative kinase-like protein TMKL1 n=1 Tax=Impatiens glandulifera TaxID=253017 RepID=UPI001FB13D5C|nr:putative kinase-like protein TMKL1 [Impatiens glandulifera]
MEERYKLTLLLSLASISAIGILYILIYIFKKTPPKYYDSPDIECGTERIENTEKLGDKQKEEELIRFRGAQDLSVYDILDAPGEVIGKSGYGTLYRANLLTCDSVAVLRFLRPVCTGETKETEAIIRVLGSIRHSNLVPLQAFYAGSKGEKLLVHPFYGGGTLAHFIRDGNCESYKWDTIHEISIGIAKGLYHLHSGFQKPIIIHGNLKSKNILLHQNNFQPQISDFGLHLVLNPTAGQEMLQVSASQGYKAPELIKMKDVSKETDVFSLGIIFLELLSRKEPLGEEYYLPNTMRDAIMERRIADLYHPHIVLGLNRDEIGTMEERILKFFQIAMACCSPSQSLRPQMKQVLRGLEEID